MTVEMAEENAIDREDHVLIQRMASKDASALDEFYTRHNRLAFSLVLRILGNREDAEDVLADLFWQVWQQSSRYDSSRGKPIAWLLTMARTRAIDRLRSRSRQPIKASEHEIPIDAAPASTAPHPINI